MPNSRLHARAPFFAEVDMLALGDELPRRVWGQDLSEGGLFLQTTQPLRPGARLSLRFDLEDAEVHVRAAEVVWVRPFEPVNVGGELPGVGVRFLSVDPPSRAAIRRFVRIAVEKKEPMSKADSLIPLPERLSLLDDAPPPAPPPLPEDAGSLELQPLTMPPISLPPVSLPPFSLLPTSVPPMSAARSSLPPTSAQPGLLVESEPGVSLPPFDDAEMPPPVVPERDEAHPLAGWRFEVAPEQDEAFEPDEATFSGPSQLGALVEEAPSGRLGLSFDDAPPETLVLPPRGAAGERHEPVEFFSTPPSLLDEPGSGHEERTDLSSFEGRVAVLELPQAEPRRSVDRKAAPSRGYGWAVGLLAAGGVAGLVMGWAPSASRDAAPDTPATASAPMRKAEPKPVFVAERELLAPSGETAQAESAPAPSSTRETARPSGGAPVAAAPVEAAPVEAAPIVAANPAERAEAAKPVESAPVEAAKPAAKAPVEAPKPVERPREDTQLASALPRAADAQGPALRVEWGRVTLPLEGGRVDRTFTLENPPRVVVDLVDARYPGAKNDEIREKGVARLRIGRPDPSHVRVVVELEGDRAPKAPSVLKRDGSLAVAWR